MAKVGNDEFLSSSPSVVTVSGDSESGREAVSADKWDEEGLKGSETDLNVAV